MDTRVARRAAEKAARDLITSRAVVVGELGVVAAERAQLAEGVSAANRRGRDLVAAAEAEAARLVAAAQDLVAEADQRYTDVYNAATGAGWTSADLVALGFQPGTASTTRRRRAAVEQPALMAPSDAPLTLPEQNSHRDHELVTEQ